MVLEPGVGIHADVDSVGAGGAEFGNTSEEFHRYILSISILLINMESSSAKRLSSTAFHHHARITETIRATQLL